MFHKLVVGSNTLCCLTTHVIESVETIIKSVLLQQSRGRQAIFVFTFDEVFLFELARRLLPRLVRFVGAFEEVHYLVLLPVLLFSLYSTVTIFLLFVVFIIVFIYILSKLEILVNKTDNSS